MEPAHSTSSHKNAEIEVDLSIESDQKMRVSRKICGLDTLQHSIWKCYTLDDKWFHLMNI